MNVEIIVSRHFQKEAKRLLKKYPSLKQELERLQSELMLNPTTGTPLGQSCYKIRIAIQSKGKGKSGGARVITHVLIALPILDEQRVYLLTIYDKSELSSIHDLDVKTLIQEARKENSD
ncbi:hypothetical protein U14_05879 [Candidatus Moduliflexus flocculans]|uniref:Addiction module toxin RelE n=1 Tax=Candidatus Moduliflexus flocculans TaxID=1499966 RepID=A0A081BT61_9BACT|nr:hypothetical protein U14_05879 [Candidatus Moduliflexus flocculans]